jgi:hypothetical protein
MPILPVTIHFFNQKEIHTLYYNLSEWHSKYFDLFQFQKALSKGMVTGKIGILVA